MSDLDGGAPADSPSVSADPVVDNVQTPNPISTEPRKAPEEPAKEPKKEPVSTRDAIKKAREQVEARDKAPKDGDPAEAARAVKSDGPSRGGDGKFAAKDGTAKDQAPNEPKQDKQGDQTAGKADPAGQKAAETSTSPHRDAPSRFSNDAKAAWETAPEPIKAEVHRAIRELEQGHQKYRADSEAFEPVRRFDEMARNGGTTLSEALTRYTNLENLLRQDVDAGRIPIRGLEEVCRNFGMSLRDVAAAVLGQSPDQVTSQQDATIRELRQELAGLKQQVGGVTQSFAKQRDDAMTATVSEFADQHPRFDELAEDIEFFLKSGRTSDLAEAYALAEKLNPAPAPAKAAEPSAAQPVDTRAQTPKGQKSIAGAPSSGSDPVIRQRPSSSIRDALRRAKELAG